MKKSLICKYCGRTIPNIEHITKNGCKGCDAIELCDITYRKAHEKKKEANA